MSQANYCRMCGIGIRHLGRTDALCSAKCRAELEERERKRKGSIWDRISDWIPINFGSWDD